MALQLCSLERRIAADAVTGMLQQEVCEVKRQLASLSLAQYHLDFVPACLLPLKTWIRSCKALCRRSCMFHTSLARKSPISCAVGRKGCTQPCFSRAVQGFEHSSLKSADVVRHAQAKPCSNSLIIKIPGRSSV